MTKEEVLAKSREENQNKDIFELDVFRKAQRIGGLIAVIVTFSLLFIEQLMDLGMNYGYYLIVLSAGSALNIYKSIRLRRKRDILLSIFLSAVAVYALIMYIMKLGEVAV